MPLRRSSRSTHSSPRQPSRPHPSRPHPSRPHLSKHRRRLPGQHPRLRPRTRPKWSRRPRRLPGRRLRCNRLRSGQREFKRRRRARDESKHSTDRVKSRGNRPIRPRTVAKVIGPRHPHRRRARPGHRDRRTRVRRLDSRQGRWHQRREYRRRGRVPADHATKIELVGETTR
jgi:hypothetical protein